MIAVDWGTTHVRAALLSSDGSVLDERHAESGVGKFTPDEFASHFSKLVSAFPESPVLAAGMVGSRQGWLEAEYVSCPASLDDLVSSIAYIESHPTTFGIIPGVKLEGTDRYDIMRGEESAIMGLLSDDSSLTATIILPGTHTKWVRVESGRIIDFRTYITGELFELLCSHSILRHSLGGSDSSASSSSPKSVFIDPSQQSGSVWSRLFGFRARDILTEQSTGLRDELSSLLVMEEVRSAFADGYEYDDYILVGSPIHTDLWSSALSVYNKSVRCYESDSLVWRFLFLVGARIGLENG